MFNFTSKKYVGLDIGSKNIKIISFVQKGKKSFKLDRYKILNLPDEIADVNAPPDKRNSILVQLLKDVFVKDRLFPKEVRISVSGPSVVIRYVKLPRLEKKELTKSIEIEAESFIPFPVSDVYLSFDIIGETLEEGIKKNEVVVVAAKKDFIDSKIQLLKEAKLIPSVINTDVFALEKAIFYNYYDIINETICVVDVGYNVVNVAIIEDGNTRVARDLNFGISNIIKEITRTQEIPTEDVLQFIKEVGLFLDEEEKSDYLKQAPKSHVVCLRSLSTFVKDLTSELRKIIDFYYFQKGEQKLISRIFLSGGGSVIKNLDLFLNEELNIHTEYIDPFRNVLNSAIIPKDLRVLFSVAVGLAINI